MGRKNIDEELESQLPLIISMIKQGCKDKEIYEKLGISKSTWSAKKSKNKKIRDAIDEATDERNSEVEEALFKNCKGYHYYEEVAFKCKKEIPQPDGSVIVQEEVEVKNVKKYSKPDLAAQKYWLNNRKKAAWKDDPNRVEIDKKNIRLKEKELKSKAIEL